MDTRRISKSPRRGKSNGRKVKDDPFLGAKPTLESLYDALRERGWEPGKVAGFPTDAHRDEHYNKILNSRTTRNNLLLACVSYENLYREKPDTVRGNMYRVVSAGWLPDTSRKSGYLPIQQLLNKLRMKRIIPFQWVVDNVRGTIKPSSWSGLADFVETVQDGYRKDFWASLPDHVELIVEKDAVAGCVQEVTKEYDIPLHPLRGFNSTSFCWQICRYWPNIKKPIYIGYIGDHDPSGRDIERDVQKKLFEISGVEVHWQRLAVEPEQFDQFDILPLEPKAKDRRTPKFTAKYGRACAEVEAIPARDLRGIVREWIESFIPHGQWGKLKRIEEDEGQSFRNAMDNLVQEMEDPEDDEEIDPAEGD